MVSRSDLETRQPSFRSRLHHLQCLGLRQDPEPLYDCFLRYTPCACSVVQACPTLCDPMDCSPPGSSVRGILQARLLERVAVPSSFPTQLSNTHLFLWQADALPRSHPGKPRDRLCIPSSSPIDMGTVWWFFGMFTEFCSDHHDVI